MKQVMLRRLPVEGRENGHITEVVTLMEGKWRENITEVVSLMEGEWLCYGGGH